jgi:hypothetical protein
MQVLRKVSHNVEAYNVVSEPLDSMMGYRFMTNAVWHKPTVQALQSVMMEVGHKVFDIRLFHDGPHLNIDA